ncbi:MAG: hypothetical protein M3N93_02705 [Acidobacteriota bacterium]|nr:hypothetical protein [Acidobacteriota bacterium]
MTAERQATLDEIVWMDRGRLRGEGTWFVETKRQAVDSAMRNIGMTPTHFKSEKPNPLDLIKNGDRVLFRIEKHKKIGGTETDMFVPFADNPAKEASLVATFIPDHEASGIAKPTDNVKALCASDRLSAERKSQLCPQ